jgi:hypothetical protein
LPKDEGVIYEMSHLHYHLSSLNIDGKGGRRVSVTLIKQLNLFVGRILKLDEKFIGEELLEQVENQIIEAANSLQTKISDLEKLKLMIFEKEKDLYKSQQVLQTIDINYFEYSHKIIEKAIELRKESYKKPSFPLNKNLLDHGVYFSRQQDRKKKTEIIEEPRKIIVDKNGLKKLTYQNDNGHLLTIFDTKVFLGLHKIWELNNKNIEFSFTEYQLLDILKLPKGGSSYNHLRKSLDNLYSTSVVLHEFSYDGSNKTLRTERFHLIEGDTKDIIFRGNEDFTYQPGEEEMDIKSVTYNIRFSAYLQDSLNQGFVSYISLAMLEDLDIPSAQGLYLMLLSMEAINEGYYEIDIKKIQEHIGLPSDLRPARLKETLEKACIQLKTIDILSDYTFHKDIGKVTYLRMTPSSWFKTLTTNTKTNKHLLIEASIL